MVSVLKSAPPTGEVEGGAQTLNQQQTDRSRFFQNRPDRIEEIKARKDVRDVARDLGIKLPEKDGEKFSSPFRPDRSPSCTIYKGNFYDHAQEHRLDVIDFYAEAKGISNKDAIAELYADVCQEQAEVSKLGKVFRRTDNESRDPLQTAQAENEARKRRRDRWTGSLRRLKDWEVDLIAAARNVCREAVELAQAAGCLEGWDSVWGPAWVLRNYERTTAQARLLAGKGWPDASNAKAKTLAGSIASNPIIGDLEKRHAIALVEGGPDFLSVYHHALASGVEDEVCPVAMLGAGLSIPDYYLALFAGHRIRIFIHDDESGRKAAGRWATQLQSVGCFVDGFSFEGLKQADGSLVRDLNDLCRLSDDSWEEHRYLIENMFSFAREGS